MAIIEIFCCVSLIEFSLFILLNRGHPGCNRGHPGCNVASVLPLAFCCVLLWSTFQALWFSLEFCSCMIVQIGALAVIMCRILRRGWWWREATSHACWVAWSKPESHGMPKKVWTRAFQLFKKFRFLSSISFPNLSLHDKCLYSQTWKPIAPIQHSFVAPS